MDIVCMLHTPWIIGELKLRPKICLYFTPVAFVVQKASSLVLESRCPESLGSVFVKSIPPSDLLA